MSELTPGLHPGIPFLDYLALDAVNNTTLKLFIGGATPAHAHWALTHPEQDTDALRLGDAVHTAILEPVRLEREYVKAPKFDKRTNAGKAEAAQWLADNPSKCALTAEEWDHATALRDAAWSHPLARELLSGPGRNEITAIWTDKPSGLLCKGRLDRLTKFQNWTTVVDLKTARDAGLRGFGKACAEFFYHMQAAFYLDGLDALSPGKRRFIHIVIEKDPPHCVAIRELDVPELREGRAQYRRALDLYARCKSEENWPGHPVGIDVQELPRWGFELTDPERL